MTSTEELLRLTRENNAMLTEIHECAIEIRNYIRWLQTSEYQDAQDVKQFAINTVANIYIDGMEEEQKRNIGKNFDKANNKNSEPQSRNLRL